MYCICPTPLLICSLSRQWPFMLPRHPGIHGQLLSPPFRIRTRSRNGNRTKIPRHQLLLRRWVSPVSLYLCLVSAWPGPSPLRPPVQSSSTQARRSLYSFPQLIPHPTRHHSYLT
ncbi:hypothetical protein ASPFODRAFT_267491 [Aspergillus luchuensis CBS 106.47]|uniref:Uncharacterized protein n=1 Tax=Aspergillus luchuensis (strain CBS 106.47) TaxID=1137211 RepID=A0A1M3U0N7_ASPLC|nr:hypothetical protein ASPFODRAFT_267491 [Aspergillus luchuensis CBS 106.47]